MAQEIVTSATESPDPTDLRVEIAKANVKQYLVAQRAGLSESELSKLLAGRKPLTDELAKRIRLAITAVAGS